MASRPSDPTAEADFISDLADEPAGGISHNNGAVAAPAGTQAHGGTDKVAAAIDTDAAPKNDKQDKAKPTSVRETLTAAFRDETGAPAAQDAPARNPDGTFAPAAAAVVPAGEGAAPAPVIQAPASMSAADLQVFSQLPAEMQQYVARTMDSVEQTGVRYQEYGALEPILAQRRDAWAMNGLSPPQAINQVLALSDFASRQPEEFIHWFATQQGIDLGILAEGAPEIDPVIQGLQGQVATLTNQLQSLTQGQQQQVQNATVDEVANFATEAGQDGKPLRPHFDQIGTGIMPYIAAVRAENPNMSNRDVLSEAYDRACWGTPAIRTALLAAQDAERLATQRTETAKAKAAGGSVVGSPASGAATPNVPGDGSVRSILKNAFAAAA